tara:strand:- start:679 stop:1218 length:540 start_codon:yes stop_codon:yes gene_type:complete
MPNKKINKPYYKVSSNFINQIFSSSKRNKTNPIYFIFKKSFNFLLEILAYNCPINSLRILFHKWRGVKIGKNVMIGLKVTLDHSYPNQIIIGDDVSLAGNNYVLAHSNPYPHFKNEIESFVSPVTIGKGSWIGIGATIMPGVKIGEYSIVAACSLVTKDVKAKSLVGGTPSRFIKQLNL